MRVACIVHTQNIENSIKLHACLKITPFGVHLGPIEVCKTLRLYDLCIQPLCIFVYTTLALTCRLDRIDLSYNVRFVIIVNLL